MTPSELVGEWETRNGSEVQITKALCNNELILGLIRKLSVNNVTIKDITIVSLWKADGNHYSDQGLDLVKRIRPTRKKIIG